MGERPIKELQAGEAFRKKMVGKADGTEGPYPWWHGWVIMDAFLAGIDYEKQRRKDRYRSLTANCGDS